MGVKGEEIARFIDESKEYIAKGDAIQASEKLYKAVEECIKVLAERYELPEYEKAKEDGRWRSYLLGRAAGKLARDLKERMIREAWAIAFEIHVWGFHEGKYGVEEVKASIPYVEWLVNFVKEREG
ncbi:MAG TPA: superfamily I DNA and RNA helicase and helicaseubunit [Anaerolineae bacterium]|nr:superfamily I DNA and RNA helicase and helicaseubunit [Anaerolineae bacterium]